MTPPHRYEVTATTAELRAAHDGLEAGDETGIEVTVAGRVMLHRAQGKLAFATLRDGSGGEIQLFALAAVTEDFGGFEHISLGDWVGATGEVVKTKRGELSVKVKTWTMLAETRRSFGDKYHGLTDVDTRYRQRYADLWANERSREVTSGVCRTCGTIRARASTKSDAEGSMRDSCNFELGTLNFEL